MKNTKYPCQMEDELKLIHSCKLYQDCLIIRFIFSVDLIKKDKWIIQEDSLNH